MSKIRIYELARELGVDNRVVISKAIEFGAPPKTSHSNSIDASEADAIRRAVIREAMGGSAVVSTRPSAGSVGMVSDSVTTRVDRSTGTTDTVFERRRGNVILRRKQGGGTDSPADMASGSAEVIEVHPPIARGGESYRPESQEQLESQLGGLVSEEQQESATVGATLGQTHEALSPRAEGETLANRTSDVPSPESAAPLKAPEEQGGVVRAEGILAQARPATTMSGKEEPVVLGPEGVADTGENSEAGLAENCDKDEADSSDFKIAEDSGEQPVGVAQDVTDKIATSSEADGSDVSKRVGPRVLGRIELPIKRPVARPEVKIVKEVTPAPRGVVAGGTIPVAVVADEDDSDKRRKKGPSKKREFSRSDLVDYEARDHRRSGKGGRASKEAERQFASEAKSIKPVKRVVKLGDGITVGDLARQMSLKAGEVIAKLIQMGIMATINQMIDKDTAMIIIDDFGYQVESTEFNEDQVRMDEGPDEEANLVSRPPVVTVMGHVDHGKTSLLDAIRKTTVASREAGGITQHIGAYSVTLEDGRVISFIDTPGHAAFTSMRARGAQVTDIVILVVAADDGVMPQTIEAINHAKAAGVPILVAVNKMDKHDANPDRVKQQLVEHGLQPEDWGGDTMYFPISAIKGTGIEGLLEGVLLVAEMKELRANPNRRAKGTVIEARQDRGRGTVATVLVQNGTLRIGDVFVVGACSGRIRAMLNHLGDRVTEATPSTPVEISGIDGMPTAGDDFFVVETEGAAREIASNRAEKVALAERMHASGPISLEEFARRANNMVAVELNLVIKADVIGSLEAVRVAVEQLSTHKVKVKVIHGGVGGITESDIQLGIASKAIVIGFGVRGEPRALSEAENNRVEVRFYRVIYELIDDVKRAMVGLLAPIREEVALGRVDVRDTFSVPKIGTVAGCFVADGIVKRGCYARVLRDSKVIYQGRLGSLRRFKDDVKQVQSGYECGISVENFNDVKVGDVIEVFEYRETEASLD
jgi:translation initiation factor IF-2